MSKRPEDPRVDDTDEEAVLPASALEENASNEARALDELVRESKTDLVPAAPDFAKMEARLMSAIAAEQSPLLADAASSRFRVRALRFGAAVLAAAAALALVVRRDGEGSLVDGAPVRTEELAAGALRATEGSGEVRVAGVSASSGQVLRAGDVVEVDGARAIVERPRKVVWLLERASGVASDEKAGAAGDAHAIARARVKSASEPLVLALDDGAIEAQVTPVPSGEAFAVDVASGTSLVRVAVHGTHLRVTRTGNHVSVDLTEGVVSIGVPPRAGTTYGTLVTAPAHVEFDASDLDGSLRIDHAPAAVRAAVPLAPYEPAPVAAKEPPPSTTSFAKEPPASASTSTSKAPNTAVAPGNAGATTAPAAPVVPPSKAVTSKATTSREAIAAAVRECAAKMSRPGDVRVTITSALRLRVRPTGDVESAQFDPPLLPEIQTCTASSIYKLKIDETGMVTIPIDVSY